MPRRQVETDENNVGGKKNRLIDNANKETVCCVGELPINCLQVTKTKRGFIVSMADRDPL